MKVKSAHCGDGYNEIPIMKSSKPSKAYWEMSGIELADATREFDKPLSPSRYKPASKADRARFTRAMKAGSQVRSLQDLGLDMKLLSEAATYARKHKMRLSEVLERGLRRELAVQ